MQESIVPQSFVSSLELDTKAARLAGSYEISGGKALIYLIPSLKHGLCIVEISPVANGAGCGIDLAAGAPVTWIEAYDGGPDPDTIRDRHLVGATDLGVAEVEILDSSSNRHTVRPTSAHVFRFVFPPAAVAAEVRVEAISAKSDDGRVVGTVRVAP